MTEFDITAKLDGVDLGVTGVGEILQNVRTIITTAKFSVPLDREFGMNATMLDLPLPVAKAKITSEIITAVHKWEPRVQVTKVFFDGDGLDGKLVPKVRVTILGT